MNNSPCAKFTTSMMPKIRVSPEATSARIIPVTIPLTVWMMMMSQGMSTVSHSQVFVNDGVIDRQFRGCGMVLNGPLFHEVDALARRQRQRYVLLHEQDCHAVPVQDLDDLADLRDHARHQTFGGFIEQDDLRFEHHGTTDGQHLLLAA